MRGYIGAVSAKRFVALGIGTLALLELMMSTRNVWSGADKYQISEQNTVKKTPWAWNK
jgi:hypothetical protein